MNSIDREIKAAHENNMYMSEVRTEALNCFLMSISPPKESEQEIHFVINV